MSWRCPQTYSEACDSIVRGWCFKSVQLGLVGESIGVLSDAGRYLPNVQRDRMAGEIIASNRLQHQRYMAKGRCYEADDVVYFATGDGRALAYVTRGGCVAVNANCRRDVRLRIALARVMPALQSLGKRNAAKPAVATGPGRMPSWSTWAHAPTAFCSRSQLRIYRAGAGTSALMSSPCKSLTVNDTSK